MSAEILRLDLGPYFLLRSGRKNTSPPPPNYQPTTSPARAELFRPDVILLLNTHFWSIRSELEELFGYRVRVLDFRQKLLHDTCRALELRGVHGDRSK